MTKEMERAGLPVAFFSAIPAIASNMGVFRIISGKAVPHVLGDPRSSREEELGLRRRLLQAGLKSLTSAVKRPTSFMPD
jgi:glycine/betaine/sarcosine/D-proline reductase family selenoprotein B